MKSVTIKIRTLTPIWTGDARQESNILKPQSILGGLRILYREILKSVPSDTQSLSVCGRTSGQSLDTCMHDENSGINSICPVCRIFGCTGYKARFSLRITGGTRGPNLKNVPSHQRNYYCQGKNGIVSSADSPITISLSTPYGDSSHLDVPLGLICFCAKYMGIGARTQWGYGAFEIENISGDIESNTPESCIIKLYDHIKSIAGITTGTTIQILNDHIFGMITFGICSPAGDTTDDANNTWTLVNTKTALRSKFVKQTGNQKCHICTNYRHKLLGKVLGNNRMASNIHVTRLHQKGSNYCFNFWGKIPNISPCSTHFPNGKNDVVSTIKNHFDTLGTVSSWSGNGLTI